MKTVNRFVRLAVAALSLPAVAHAGSLEELRGSAADVATPQIGAVREVAASSAGGPAQDPARPPFIHQLRELQPVLAAAATKLAGSGCGISGISLEDAGKDGQALVFTVQGTDSAGQLASARYRLTEKEFSKSPSGLEKFRLTWKHTLDPFYDPGFYEDLYGVDSRMLYNDKPTYVLTRHVKDRDRTPMFEFAPDGLFRGFGKGAFGGGDVFCVSDSLFRVGDSGAIGDRLSPAESLRLKNLGDYVYWYVPNHSSYSRGSGAGHRIDVTHTDQRSVAEIRIASDGGATSPFITVDPDGRVSPDVRNAAGTVVGPLADSDQQKRFAPQLNYWLSDRSAELRPKSWTEQTDDSYKSDAELHKGDLYK